MSLSNGVHGSRGRLAAWQRWLGVATVVAFLGTGWVLRLHQPPMDGLDTGFRVLLRSGHVYVLFVGLLNVALGLAAPLHGARGGPPGTARRRLALAGAALAMTSAPLMLAAFFAESARHVLDRPLTLVAVVAAFLGTLLVLAASWGAGD